MSLPSALLQPLTAPPAKAQPARLAWPDQLRGLALAAMVSFHFTWDLTFFHFIGPVFADSLGFRLYGHAIASTFLVLVGVSLVLAQRSRQPWPGYWRRMARLSFSAAAITIVTFYVMGSGFIFFGILHCIVLASLAALPFLFLPTGFGVAAMALAFALPLLIHSPALDGPDFWWLGLGTHLPVSDDIRPFLPWTGMVLAGVLAARWLQLWRLRGGLVQGRAGRGLATAGRHSLLIYMIHQPLMFGTLALLAHFFVAPTPVLSAFENNCRLQCTSQGRDAAFCVSACTCLVGRLKADGLWRGAQTGLLSTPQARQVASEALVCIRP